MARLLQLGRMKTARIDTLDALLWLAMLGMTLFHFSFDLNHG
ncbi:MAG: hypothetical protein ACOYNF_02430 [Rhodoferax sp.]